MKRPTEDQAIMAGIVLVFILAAAHNYAALQDFAFNAGVPWLLSFATPILFDLFIAIAVWVTLRNKRYDEPARLGWGIVYAFTLTSIVLNAMHYPFTPGGMAMALIVPSVVFCSAELGKGLVESARKRGDVVMGLAELTQQREHLASDVNRLGEQVTQAGAKLEQTKAEIEQARNELKAVHFQQKSASVAEMNAAKLAKIEARRADVLSLARQGMNPPAIADELKVSLSTVKRDLVQLNGKVAQVAG